MIFAESKSTSKRRRENEKKIEKNKKTAIDYSWKYWDILGHTMVIASNIFSSIGLHFFSAANCNSCLAFFAL